MEFWEMPSGGLADGLGVIPRIEDFLAAAAAALFSAAVPLAALLAENAFKLLELDRPPLPPDVGLCRLLLIRRLPEEGKEGDRGKPPPPAAV